MRHDLFAVFSLTALLMACAHDSANQHAHQRQTERVGARNATHDGQRSAGNEAQHQAQNRQKQRAEDVDVPRHRAQRKRLASVDDQLPADERREGGNVTPLDQGNGEGDLDVTQRIRKAVMADDSLSFAAKNTTIVTTNGHVTLRGSVKSVAEKNALYRTAVSEAGVGHVTSHLEVDGD